MSNNLLFITLAAITLFQISAYTFIMVRFTDTQKQIKDIADNQFDAEEVMKLYNMKFNRPIVTKEQADITEIKCSFEIPYEVYRDMLDGRIDQTEFIQRNSSALFEKQIASYIEYVIDDVPARCTKGVNARLRVVNGRKK